MLHLRRLIRPLVVLALFATALAVATSPAVAQSTIEVFKFVNRDDGLNGTWEVRVTVKSLGGCNPDQGEAGYVSGWLEVDEEGGVVLDAGVCTYVVTAVARSSSRPGEICDAGLAWGASVGTATQLLTSDAGRGALTEVSVQHAGGSSPVCAQSSVLTFKIEPDDVVQALPATAADADMTARAKRAVEITDFQVRVTPDSSTVSRTGCDQSLRFTMRGDGDEVEEAMEPIAQGVTCKWRAFIVGAPEPFVVTDASGEPFSTADASNGSINVDLSGQVGLPYARIAVIQDVTNSGNEDYASYTVSRACAGVAALPPTALGAGGSGIFTLPGGQKVATLREGRFTVHAPNFANFGPSAVYPAVATSTTSNSIGGCSVTVAINDLPAKCSTAGSDVRTLTWTASNPVRHFDFEFDIDCGGSATPPTTAPELPPPPPPTDDGASGPSGPPPDSPTG